MLNQIVDSISLKLKDLFPDCKIYVEEIREDFIYPCFFIDVVDTQKIEKLNDRFEMQVMIDISYFVDSEQENTNFRETASTLLTEFKYLSIDSKLVHVTDKVIDDFDNTLHFKFTIRPMYKYVPSVGIKMAEIDINNDVEE